MLGTAEQHELHDLIGVGPNMQLRADGIGTRLTGILEKQAAAMSNTVQLYRMYRAECRQRRLRAKGISADAVLGIGQSTNPVSPSGR
ncbi:hypothetical protein LCGC14_0399770 [marine sediment metagenome]|uniref:Uncharacterized protein n=1 Tax=marine sediment metagenome TaxID=412755 RepID=A0A0F9SX85_9ZZZZ